MSSLKTLAFILLFYGLVIWQLSFLPHFNSSGAVFNLVFIFVLLFNFFEKPQSKTGIAAGFIGGALLDIFSFHPFGVFVLTLTALSFLIKALTPFFRKASVLSFVIVFMAAFLFNFFASWFLSETLGLLFENDFVFVLTFNLQMLFWGLALNFFLSLVCFYFSRFALRSAA